MTEPMQSHPYYSEGFHDAWHGDPLFDDAHPIYRAGWLAFYEAKRILQQMSNQAA